jgi:hypothetical protein
LKWAIAVALAIGLFLLPDRAAAETPFKASLIGKFPPDRPDISIARHVRLRCYNRWLGSRPDSEALWTATGVPRPGASVSAAAFEAICEKPWMATLLHLAP